jgi:endonuclease I
MLLILVLLVSTLVIPTSAASTQPSKYSSEYNSGQRGVVCTTLSGTSAASYYTGSYTYDTLSQLSSTALQSQLKTLMTQTHKYTSSYNDCHYKAHRTDCENGTGNGSDEKTQKLLLIYTSYTATQSQWNGWNREHVWPQSLGGGNTSGGGADLHHVRPSDAGVNSSRGNKKYGEAGSGASSKTGTNPATGYLGGYYNSVYFEPLDNVKGDVARIILYVWIRWGSSWGADSVTEVFQSVDVLLEWCALDPVDTWEMGRNEVVQDIQGNRNVFIDYPEYAWLVFGREVPADIETPSGEASDGTGSGSGSGSSTPSCTHTTTEIRNKTNATCTSTGYTGDTYCVSCGVKTATGTTVAKLSHSWSAWTNNGSGMMIRTCTYNCGATETSACTHPNTEVKDKVNATCTTGGYTGDTYCKLCGVKTATGTATAKTGHIWGSWTVVDDKTMTRTCFLNCGATETKTYCAHHETEVRNNRDATCAAAGYTGDTYCTACNEKITTGSAIAKLPHSYGEWEIDEAAEIKTRICSGCGDKEEAPYIPECTHTETELRGAVAATCTATGYTGDTVCKRCSEVIVAGQIVPATGNHTDTELRDAKAPTCNEAGNTGNTVCKTCGALIEVGQVIPATGNHVNTEVRDAKAATCSTEGYTGNTFCEDCDEQIAIGQAIPATGNHAWGDTVISVEPEQGKDGLGFSTCSHCGESKTVIIEALPIIFGAGYENNCEKIIAIVSKNALYTYIVGLLTGA